MKFLLKMFAILLAMFLISGCSSSDSTDSSVTGTFVDDPVSGLTYECSSGTVGVTTEEGEYTCENGDNVTFSIGDVLIGTVTAEVGIVTPYSFFPNNQDGQEAALNLARLLQSVDSDPSDDIITLDVALVASLDPSTDFTSSDFETVVQDALSITLVSVEDAQTQLNETIASAGADVPDGANIPVADAGTNQSVHNNDVVTLDGSASSDADGDSLTYIWSITSKPVTSGATLSDVTVVNPIFTADEIGSYVLKLIVNDGSINSVPDEVTIVAALDNAAPVANAGANQNVNTTDTVTLHGSGTDADGNSLTYNWTITDKPATSIATLSDATAEEPTFEADLDGSYEIQLIVNDGSVDSAPDTIVVIATTTNSAPVAEAGDSQSKTTGDSVTLDGSGSTDSNSDTLTYLWNMTSKPGGSSAVLSSITAVNPTFTADVEGAYVISLVVNDGTVDSIADTVTVTATTVVSSIFHNGTSYSTVTSLDTSRIWLDRNLGASRVCTALNDVACYGDYYQWGRNYDGHEDFNSAISPTLATDINSAGTDFIDPPSSTTTWDWTTIDSDGALRASNWSAVDGSSICPADFRVATVAELEAETSITSKETAFNSLLKLPSAGYRTPAGLMEAQGTFGAIWASDPLGTDSGSFYFTSSGDDNRAYGFTVRCIKP